MKMRVVSKVKNGDDETTRGEHEAEQGEGGRAEAERRDRARCEQFDCLCSLPYAHAYAYVV